MDKNRKIEIILCSVLLTLILISSIYLGYLKLHVPKETTDNVSNQEHIFNFEDEKLEKIQIMKLINEKAEFENEDVIDETVIESTSLNKEYTYEGSYVYCNNMDFSRLKEPGWMINYDDAKYTSILGLDVSEYNGYVDFYSLKEQGFDFVMLRVGWRGSTEGGIYKDKNFEDYYAEAVDAGLNIGYYFFSQAKNEDEAIEEANFVLGIIKDKQCDMFVAFDMETSIDGDGRIDNLSWFQRTNNAIAFSNEIENAGYDPMIYTNLDWARNYYDVNDFNSRGIAIWLAQYSGYPNVNFNYAMWQYTAKASIPGVSLTGRTDINLMLIEK